MVLHYCLILRSLLLAVLAQRALYASCLHCCSSLAEMRGLCGCMCAFCLLQSTLKLCFLTSCDGRVRDARMFFWSFTCFAATDRCNIFFADFRHCHLERGICSGVHESHTGVVLYFAHIEGPLMCYIVLAIMVGSLSATCM